MDFAGYLVHLQGRMHDFPTSFYLMCVMVLGVAGWGILTGNRLMELPVVVALFVIAWLIPEGLTAERLTPWTTASDELFWSYVTGCLLFLFLFFYVGKFVAARLTRRNRGRPVKLAFDYDRLLKFNIVLLAVGVLSAVLMMRRSGDFSGGQQWTGIITAYALFAGNRVLALCLAALLYFRTGRRIPLALMLIALASMLPTLSEGLKRASAFDLLVAVGGSYFMVRRVFPPRTLVLACAVAGTLLLHQISMLRSARATGESVTEVVLSGELFEQFSYFHLPDAFEVRGAKSNFQYVRQHNDYSYGEDYWNGLVQQYVPSFLLGRDFKNRLFFDTAMRKAALNQGGLFYSAGATRTGFADTFGSFSYFGVLVFALMGFGGGMLYRRAMSGDIRAQFFYLSLLSQYLMAITNTTYNMLNALVFLLIMTYPGFLYAVEHKPVRKAPWRYRQRLSRAPPARG